MHVCFLSFGVNLDEMSKCFHLSKIGLRDTLGLIFVKISCKIFITVSI